MPLPDNRIKSLGAILTCRYNKIIHTSIALYANVREVVMRKMREYGSVEIWGDNLKMRWYGVPGYKLQVSGMHTHRFRLPVIGTT
jgi:hypothetical protein